MIPIGETRIETMARLHRADFDRARLVNDLISFWVNSNGSYIDQALQAYANANPGHEQAARDEGLSRIKAAAKASAQRHVQLMAAGRAQFSDMTVDDYDIRAYVSSPGKVDPYSIAVREGRAPDRVTVSPSKTSQGNR